MTSPPSDIAHAREAAVTAQDIRDRLDAIRAAAAFDRHVEQAMRLAEHTAKAMRRIDGEEQGDG